MVEVIVVLVEGWIFNNDLGIWDDNLIEGLYKMIIFIYDNGVKVVI